MTEKLSFCTNSRRWLVFETMNPRSCPYEKERCPGCCGYYQEREPTKYVLRKMKILKSMFGNRRTKAKP